MEDDYVRFNNAFSYDATTGKVYWKISPRYGITIGDEAGMVDANGYGKITFKQNRYKTHRVVWLLYYKKWPTKQIDHINGITTDNRICNLRDVSQRDNCCNRVEHRNGHKVGASFSRNRWCSHITLNNILYNLGQYDTQEEAENAYKVVLKNFQDDPLWVPNRISKGYNYVPRLNKYEVRVQVNGKRKHFGSFATPEEAHAVYLKEKYGTPVKEEM